MITLRPLRIGHLEIDFPLVLAALAGYSDLPYRLICRRLGSPYCATEAMLDTHMLVGGKLRRRLVHRAHDDHPVAGQIMGSDPKTMATAAKELVRMGFDVIDLNFACPVRKVVSRKRGGHLMGQPQRAIEIIRAVVATVDAPVTIKLRRAFRESDVECDAFWRIAEAGFDAGVAAVCAHARSVDQKYMGQADWGFLRRAKAHFADRTIIGSGDVHTPDDALRMLELTGVDGVTAARGAIGNPWLFRQARDLAQGRQPHQPSLAEQRLVLADHFDAVCGLYGPRRGPKIMRKFGIKYARMHPTPAKVRAGFIAVQRASQWHAVLDEHYGQPSPIGC